MGAQQHAVFVVCLLLMVLKFSPAIAFKPWYEPTGKVIPSRYQKSYPLIGLVCFPDGVRLPCECEIERYHCPCCRDYLTHECYQPTFHCWSQWLPCTLENDLCYNWQECRIKYEKFRHNSTNWNSTWSTGLPRILHEPGAPSCQVQIMECRNRTIGHWGDWFSVGNCSETCIIGKQYRCRECFDGNNNTIDHKYCEDGGELWKEEIDCNVDACPEAMAWAPAGDCYWDGNDCVQNMTRSCNGTPELTPECRNSIQDCSTCNPCQLEPCDNAGMCSRKGDGYECTCTEGFRGESCSENINECADEMDECDKNATCTDSHGSYRCECNEGYSGDGYNCTALFFGYLYTEWSPCDSVCTPGSQSSNGTCVLLSDNSSSTLCDPLVNEKHRSCNTDYCSEYEITTPLTNCTVECGGGTLLADRQCKNTSSVSPEGCETINVTCNTHDCVVYGNWAVWTLCNETCSPGWQSRTRECFIEGTTTPSDDCTDKLEETRPCNTNSCVAYTAYQDSGPCLGSWNGSTCLPPMIPSTRGCLNTSQVVPDGCSEGESRPCSPGASKDVLIIVDNSNQLEFQRCSQESLQGNNGLPYPHPDLSNSTALPSFTAQNEFLHNFICGFNVFAENDSHLAIYESHKDTDCVNKLTDLSEHNLTNVVNERPLRCISFNIFGTLICPVFGGVLTGAGSRPSADDIILYVLPTFTDTVSSDIKANLLDNAGILGATKTRYAGKTFGVVSIEDISTLDATKQARIHQLACFDRTASSCANYLGHVGKDISAIITDLLALSPLV